MSSALTPPKQRQGTSVLANNSSSPHDTLAHTHTSHRHAYLQKSPSSQKLAVPLTQRVMVWAGNGARFRESLRYVPSCDLVLTHSCTIPLNPPACALTGQPHPSAVLLLAPWNRLPPNMQGSSTPQQHRWLRHTAACAAVGEAFSCACR
jgi:hypothetical protein